MIDDKRPARYQRIYTQLQGLIEGQSPNLIAAMATICAVLHHKLNHHFWTGFYLAAQQDEQDTGADPILYVGPYQGPVACQVLRDRGVCLHCVRTQRPVIVPDVEQFPGHIACDSRSKSEIALPVTRDGVVIAVLDVDSDRLAQFDEDDVPALSQILSLLQPYTSRQTGQNP
ncbi:MAG TPA: GAF domain-containing protein [Chloroflexi bacterium]|nr:GAF domain-containing protein [Chloroflexota bacterium]